jgi:hypothetical protein
VIRYSFTDLPTTFKYRGFKHITSNGRTFHAEAVVNYLIFSGVDKAPANSGAREGPPDVRNTKICRFFRTELLSSDRRTYPGTLLSNLGETSLILIRGPQLWNSGGVAPVTLTTVAILRTRLFARIHANHKKFS